MQSNEDTIVLSHEDLQVAASLMENEDNNFSRFLKEGELLIQEGLTPYYIFDKMLGTLQVTSYQKIMNGMN